MRRFNWLGVAVLAGLLLVPASAAQAGRGNKKPDLVPQAARFEGAPYGFIGERPTSAVTDATTNRGERRAGPSLTRIFLEKGNIRGDVGDRAVPGVRPGNFDRGTSDLTDIDVFDPGAYQVRICVDAKHDVAESNEGNNCGRVKGVFYVTKRTWTGTLSGFFAQSGDVLERWSSTDASLVFQEYLGGGDFTYGFQGTVSWMISGTDAGGCSWSGSGSSTMSPAVENGGLNLDLGNGEYRAGINAPQGFHYDQQVNCEFGSGAQQGPSSPIFLLTAEGAKPFPFGTATITGNAAEEFVNRTYVWDFR